MFHYRYQTMSGKRGRLSHDILVGDVVESRYRARWKGVVVSLDPVGGCATVTMTHTRRGAPLRKAETRTLHCRWFKVISR